MYRTNITRQLPHHNHSVVLQSCVASNSTGPQENQKSSQAVYFYSCEPCAIFSTRPKITFPTHIKQPEQGEVAGDTFCSFHCLSYVWGGFFLLRKLLSKGLPFRNALTTVPSPRVQPEKRLARSPSKLVVLWIANKSNFTSISFALVRMILESSALQERRDIEKTNVVFHKDLKPNTGTQSIPQRDFHHKTQANS